MNFICGPLTVSIRFWCAFYSREITRDWYRLTTNIQCNFYVNFIAANVYGGDWPIKKTQIVWHEVFVFSLHLKNRKKGQALEKKRNECADSTMIMTYFRFSEIKYFTVLAWEHVLDWMSIRKKIFWMRNKNKSMNVEPIFIFCVFFFILFV